MIFHCWKQVPVAILLLYKSFIPIPTTYHYNSTRLFITKVCSFDCPLLCYYNREAIKWNLKNVQKQPSFCSPCNVMEYKIELKTHTVILYPRAHEGIDNRVIICSVCHHLIIDHLCVCHPAHTCGGYRCACLCVYLHVCTVVESNRVLTCTIQSPTK